MKVILASSSKYRKELLERFGITFSAIASDVDEDPIQNDKSITNVDKAQALAKLKALAVASEHPGAIIIGSDQIAELDGQTLGKPGTVDNAVKQLSAMSGKTHYLHTAVCLVDSKGCEVFCNTTTLKMRALSEEQIKRYVDFDHPLDCAGAYKLESKGIALFESIETSDSTAIIGLPLIELGTKLIERGIQIL